jgi:LysR family positive regulator for ilvC
MDDHRDLRLYLHLAETLNFGRTSADCHVSAATLTRVVQRLEASAGARLLDRGPRGVALTAAGLRFRGYAAEVLRLWESYRRDGGDGTPGLAGRLSLFASVTACQTLLPDLLAPFRAAHPRVTLDLHTGDAAAALARLDEGTTDLAVAALPPRLPAPLVSREITRTPLVVVTAHSGETGEVDWGSVPLVLPRGGLAREAAQRWLRRRRITPVAVSEVDGHEALLTLVALGCGVGVVPELVLAASPVAGRLAVVPVEPPVGEFRIGLCARRTELRRPLVSALWSSV